MERLAAPSLNELANALHELVNINDVQELDSTSGGSEVTCNQNCLRRYVSFPSLAKMISEYSSSEEEGEVTNMASEKLIIHELAPPVKLVSAIKGSREKQGYHPPEKLQVTWSPDVYEPTPTSVSHAGQRGTRQQKQSRNNRRGKKGKDLPRGDGIKDKKKKKKKKRSSQTTAIPGTFYNGNNELEHTSEMENFGFGGSDSCCSSSFFKDEFEKVAYCSKTLRNLAN